MGAEERRPIVGVWWLWRPWRRAIRPLGTLGGNPSVVDEVLAEGPPVDLDGDIDFGLYAQEKAAAVHGDLLRDMSSDFDEAGAAESHMWDALGKQDGDAG